ncbi:MAG: 23S rRNA (adenine(2503)-C(2))-methyltransferase RlmN [Sediminibacterium sp.]|nr:23S rRNA (adenine(2503)-C(2))-methyltransferase RlmN [Sediminibacterium sp.]
MYTEIKKNLRQIEQQTLKEYLAAKSFPKYTFNQINDWLWNKKVLQIDQMSNLSKTVRTTLEQDFSLASLEIDREQESTDGTIKIRFKTQDGFFIESVMIPTENRLTACLSSQVGCSLTCSFCATGKMKRKRNLQSVEIFEQFLILNKKCLDKFNKPLTNIVYMGMGEPLLNYHHVLQSIDFISNANFCGLSPKRITLSTAGISKQIRQLADDKVRFNLAVSLHAADDAKREKIMPINKTNNLQDLKEALLYFYNETEGDISLEYILFKGFNDSSEDAQNLIKFYRQIPIRLVNIIEYNSIGDNFFRKTSEEDCQQFVDILQKNRVNTRIRKSRGPDIDAACGQLANKN